MTEKEKTYFVCILFPVFWVFLPALIASDIVEAIKAWRQGHGNTGEGS
jgi:hypothetical protein